MIKTLRLTVILSILMIGLSYQTLAQSNKRQDDEKLARQFYNAQQYDKESDMYLKLYQEYNYYQYLSRYVDCQYYLNEFADAIGYTPTEQESEQPSIIVDDEPIADEDANQEWVYGYKGIMSAFKWGRNKVAGFLKDSYYAEAIVREGDKIAVNVPKARELMQKKEQERKNPKRRRC